MTGYVIYEGPSELDGKPIVVIATDNSGNRKTGSMVQTWILRADIEPHTALKTGDDSSVCGDCPHRPANHGACYVTVFQAPLAVYRAYKRGSYGEFQPGQFAGRMVRIGSYGDPAAVPLEIWEAYTDGAAGMTGYSHQWGNADKGLSAYCMASCDTPAERERAVSMGWRTFRVRLADEPVMQGEAVCPASHEAGQKLTCDKCKACSGTTGHRSLSGIAIVAHGAAGKVNAYNAMRAA